MSTFCAPASRCFCAPSRFVKMPVDSSATSIPRSPHGSAAGSFSFRSFISLPSTRIAPSAASTSASSGPSTESYFRRCAIVVASPRSLTATISTSAPLLAGGAEEVPPDPPEPVDPNPHAHAKPPGRPRASLSTAARRKERAGGEAPRTTSPSGFNRAPDRRRRTGSESNTGRARTRSARSIDQRAIGGFKNALGGYLRKLRSRSPRLHVSASRAASRAAGARPSSSRAGGSGRRARAAARSDGAGAGARPRGARARARRAGPLDSSRSIARSCASAARLARREVRVVGVREAVRPRRASPRRPRASLEARAPPPARP